MGRFGTEDVPIKEILFAYQSTIKSELMDKSPGPRPLKKFSAIFRKRYRTRKFSGRLFFRACRH